MIPTNQETSFSISDIVEPTAFIPSTVFAQLEEASETAERPARLNRKYHTPVRCEYMDCGETFLRPTERK